MKQATVRESRDVSMVPTCVGVLLACIACQSALAQAAAEPERPLREQSAGRLELSTSTLPRLESQDYPVGGDRIDMTWQPQRSSVGLAVGLQSQRATGLAGAAGSTAQPPNLDLGMRWRTSADSYPIDVGAWRRMNAQPDAWKLVQQREATTYVARVELNLNRGEMRRSGLVADKGFIGLQMEGGGRISLKRKDRSTMVYYRTNF